MNGNLLDSLRSRCYLEIYRFESPITHHGASTMPRRLFFGFCLLLITFVTVAPAQETKQAPLSDSFNKSIHTVKTTAGEIQYTATAGTLILKEEDGTPLASMFFVAYTKNGADLTKRPLTFAFNGGPGSSSVWLHMGAFG